MRYSVSLKENHAFRRAYSRGKSAVSPYLVLYVRKNGLGVNRLGITVSVKLGTAVTRNRVRRRFREIYRLNEEKFIPGCDLVIVARGRSVGAKWSTLVSELLRLAERLGVRA